MEGLGKYYNVVHNAKNRWINVRDAGGVDYLGYLTGGVGDTYTLTQAKDAAGTGAASLVTITGYWTSTGDGTDTWTRRGQANGATVTTTATAAQNSVMIPIDVEELDDGFSYVRLTSSGAATIVALVRDLKVARRPSNLPGLST